MKKHIYLTITIMVLTVVGCQKDSIQKPDTSDLTSNSAEYKGIKEYILNDPFLRYFFYGSTVLGRSEDALLERIKLELAAQDKKNKFLKNLYTKYGLILWDKVTRNQNENDDKVLYFLPMAEEKMNELSAVILAGIAYGKITFNLVPKNKVNQLLAVSKGKENWENLPALVMYFLNNDYEIFNLKNHEYSKWLSEYGKSKLNQVEERLYSAFTYCTEICTRWHTAFTSSDSPYESNSVTDRSIPGCAESYTSCETIWVWVEDCWYCNNPGNTNGTTPGGSGGSTNTSTSSTSNTVSPARTAALDKHQELKNLYPDYAVNFYDVDINSYLNQVGEAKFLTTAAFYESFHELGITPRVSIDRDYLHFLLVFVKKELLPIGITIIPYGIGDAADIFLNCIKSSNLWQCTLALVGAIVPFDELWTAVKLG
jgi:hypothetical protein